MHNSSERLRHEIMEMAEHDLSVRQELAADGSLSKHGYHPRMEAVHTHNAERLATMIEEHGWPGKSLVGEDGAKAAWLIATQFQPDENGELVPYPIENPEGVNERRLAVGLNSLEERMLELREQAEHEAVPLRAEWEEQYERWLRSAGWRS